MHPECGQAQPKRIPGGSRRWSGRRPFDSDRSPLYALPHDRRSPTFGLPRHCRRRVPPPWRQAGASRPTRPTGVRKLRRCRAEGRPTLAEQPRVTPWCDSWPRGSWRDSMPLPQPYPGRPPPTRRPSPDRLPARTVRAHQPASSRYGRAGKPCLLRSVLGVAAVLPPPLLPSEQCGAVPAAPVRHSRSARLTGPAMPARFVRSAPQTCPHLVAARWACGDRSRLLEQPTAHSTGGGSLADTPILRGHRAAFCATRGSGMTRSRAGSQYARRVRARLDTCSTRRWCFGTSTTRSSRLAAWAVRGSSRGTGFEAHTPGHWHDSTSSTRTTSENGVARCREPLTR